MFRRTVSAIMLTLLLTSMLTLAFNIQPGKASGTIYIRADGSIDPPYAPIQRNGVVYTLTDDISDDIQVQKNDITIDGMDWIIRNSGTPRGLSLVNVSGVTVKNIVFNSSQLYVFGCLNVNISGNIMIFSVNYALDSIYVDRTNSSTIINNRITNSVNGDGIYLGYSYGNILSKNEIGAQTKCFCKGISLVYSSANNISGNHITNEGYAIDVSGGAHNTFHNNDMTNNGFNDIVAHASSDNMISRNNMTADISLFDCSNNVIYQNNMRNSVLKISSSSNNSILENVMTNNESAEESGMAFLYCSGNIVSGNVIEGRAEFWVGGGRELGGSEPKYFMHFVDSSNLINGKPMYYFVNQTDFIVDSSIIHSQVGYLALINCANVTVADLTVANSLAFDTPLLLLAYTTNSTISNCRTIGDPEVEWAGIDLEYCREIAVFRNRIGNCNNGIVLHNSSDNTVSENFVENNKIGIKLDTTACINNRFYHNNFSNNTLYDVTLWAYYNFFDDGYPSGGNYWDKYHGVDAYKGMHQDEPGSDGIGDAPYVIDANNRDRYPLMTPWTPTPTTPDFSIAASPTSLTIQQGGLDTSLITIRSIAGFNQPVQLTVSGAPSEGTTTISPQQVTPPQDGSTTSTLTVTVSTTANLENNILTVTGTNGTLAHSTSISLEIIAPQPNQPPVSSFIYSPASPVNSGAMVSFNASGSYDPEGRTINYEWNFGDGETATGRTVSHRFRGATVDPQTNVPRTKNYIITLTVRDDKGATDTESASLAVEPLRKTINLDPGYFGVSCWMEAVYNWVGTDEATGENLYIISRIDTYSGGISGAYQLFILRRISPPPSIPKLVWHIPLPTMPILRTYATPFTPSLWQELWGTTCDLTTLIFPDGTFEGIGVTDTSLMLIVATGTETGITAYYDLGTVKFEPSSPVVHLKPEELKELSELKDILDLLNKLIGIIGSPCELRVYDSEGRVTGLVSGEIKEEIPGSAYVNGSIMILYPNQTYRYEVVGTENGTYKLLITVVEDVNATTFIATEIPTLSNANHTYTIDWAALARGEEGVTVQVDSDCDGVFELTFTSDAELPASEFIPEFPSFLILPLFIIATLLAVIVYRRKNPAT